jgi:hypothetical protein
MGIRRKIYIGLTILIQTIQIALVIFAAKLPVAEEAIFFPELLVKACEGAYDLSSAEKFGIAIGIVSWVLLVICIVELYHVYERKILPLSAEIGIVAAGILVFAILNAGLQGVSNFLFPLMFLKTDMVALVLLGLLLMEEKETRNKILRSKEIK